MQTAGAAKTGESKIDQSKINILLVDDRPENLLALEAILEPLGQNLVRASSGREALRHLLSEEFALILMDVQMPGLDGFATAVLIKQREKSRSIPIIFVTAINKSDTYVFEGYSAGAVDYIFKPIDPDILKSKVAVFVELFEKSQEIKRQAELLSARNQEMQSDLNLAREIQQAFILKQYPSFPHMAMPSESTLRFCHRYLPTTTLGGDFFDVLALSDSMAGVFICDVMGHGVRSALVTAMMRALVGERTGTAHDPGEFLTELNRHLLGILQQTSAAMFASAFYLVADVERGRLSYANAGHPSPLRVQRDSGQVESLVQDYATSGPALGLFESAVYKTHCCDMASGDLFVLLTDGLFEVEGADGEYGEDRLIATARRNLHLPCAELFDALLEDIQEYSATGEFDDDVCIMGMEVS
jgi:sigma-B regulation protein RsbU (phosphoserine phosphatase)